MTDVEVTVRLGREACLHSSLVLSLAEVILYYLLNEIQAFFLAICRFILYLCHSGKCLFSIGKIIEKNAKHIAAVQINSFNGFALCLVSQKTPPRGVVLRGGVASL
jgi:hypothetical protein